MAYLSISNIFSARRLRKDSLSRVESLGYVANRRLPLLDAGTQVMRGAEQVAIRMLAIYCTVAVANGVSPQLALEWVSNEGLLTELTPDELSYLTNPLEKEKARYRAQEEALLALAWASSFHDHLDYSKYCDSRLARFFPRPSKGDASRPFITRAKLRPEDEVVAALDMGYCLHAAVVDEEMNKQTKTHDVEPYVIVERRRALEWLVSDDNWGAVSLDT